MQKKERKKKNERSKRKKKVKKSITKPYCEEPVLLTGFRKARMV